MLWTLVEKDLERLKMRARLLLLFYFYALKGQYAPVVQYPAWVRVEVGSTVMLQCRTKIIGTNCGKVVWTKMDPRTKMLVSIMNTNSNASVGYETVCQFSIKKAKTADSGTYYCSVVFATLPYTGNGSVVIVTQENQAESPSVDILWPHSIRPLIPLLCVVSRVVPSEARVFWVIDGEEHSGFTESLWTNDNNEIVESSQNQVLVHAEEWERGVVCTCVVEFAGKNASKSVNQGHSGVCTVILYGVMAGTGLTIIMAISIAVFLHRGHSARSDGDAREQRRPTGLEHRHRSGRPGRGSAIDLTITEVQYTTLQEASLARRT